MISLFCDDLKKIRHFECCPGCHQADENGTMDFHAANYNVDGESVFVHGCCASHLCCIKAEHLGPAIENRLNMIRSMERKAE